MALLMLLVRLVFAALSAFLSSRLDTPDPILTFDLVNFQAGVFFYTVPLGHIKTL